ncbi:PAS domain-containing sensor histidine kinase [Desulfopila sp. IMCC35008]|uniref:hybrid sensor histidine kinase/response regulator n=1 Tax=Desulfopila sp. IMCC35008 TaxID=2653858 RepID=UPI0013D531E3|nr:PAS domain-containing sensor histidine kinase [Desulfopila sp. IMCC35008]
MPEEFTRKHLHSKTTMFILLAVLLSLFALFAYWYKTRLIDKETLRVANHAKVISASLWNYDKLTPLDYLKLSMDANGYQKITVRDEYDRVFLRLEGKPVSPLEQLFTTTKLIHRHRLQSDITFNEKVIGTINVIWPCRAIYIYLYILFCIILLLNGIALYLKLLDAKLLLESRVQQRTAELESEIQERKRAQEELKFQAQRLSLHVRHTPLAVVEWSPDFKVIEWNKAAEKIFEFSRAEMLGESPFGTILPDSGDKEIEQIWQNLIEQSGGTRSVNSNRTKSGKIKTCDWYNTPLSDTEGNIIGVASLVLDITDQVEAENKNKLLQEQLVQAQKMEAVGNIAGGIAHDFNNLLQSISGYTQLLLLEFQQKGEDSTKLKGIERASRRAADLIQQLLTFSRKIESNLAPLNLNKEIVQIRRMLDRTIPKMINIDMKLDPDLNHIKGDPVQIEQIMLNLAINASHAMPEGGTLSITTTNVTLDPIFCAAHLGAKEGQNVLLQVFDTGIGMDSETIKRIFDPFFTTKETGKGTGLGLSSVYGIVQGHGGFIECTSTKRKGTCFRIYFPAIPQQQQIAVTDRDELPITGGTETVLLVDDESTIREIGTEMLVNYGYTVFPASSGEEGLEVYKKRGDSIDIIIMDLNMPGMGGFKCIQQLKHLDPNCLVLVASGYTPTESIQQATELGAEGFLFKPFQMADFLKKIRQTLDQKNEP